MTKKLQDLFDLPTTETDSVTESVNELQAPLVEGITKEALNSLEKIENALPQVKGLDAADSEMDALTDLATSSYKDLMDLGMQVDSRFSAEIFGVAGTMLGHAITAKTAKLNKKLKMIELQLKKAALDAKSADKDKEVENVPLGAGQALDRNELLKILNGKNQE